MKKSFTEHVLDIVKNIPKGETLSYKQVATKAGSPKAFRVVGTIMKNNYQKDIPCHRVIKSNGKIGNYNRGGEKAKTSILASEGFVV